MAVEYDLESDTQAEITEIRAFLETALGGDPSPDGTVFCQGMYVMSTRIAPDEERSTAELTGFTHRITVTFRFANLATPDVRDRNTALMVKSVIAFSERFGGSGLLLFNGERAVAQWTPDGLVFDSGWEDWTEVAAVIPLLAGHTMRALPQPFL
ncbi:SitI3 family protein [Actinoplanes sp. NBC_00393]|uniref:SitI3 family protein n=1 Tax=Actinoplanes sp. NBC_00393 TaxID=2975953 RepID=UPI002E1ED037